MCVERLAAVAPAGDRRGRGADDAQAGPAGRPGLASRALIALPEALPAATMGFTLPAMLLLLIGHYSPITVLVLGLPGAVLAVWGGEFGNGAWAGVGSGRAAPRAAGWTGAAVVVVLAWIVVNIFLSAQDLYATRDPAAYGLAGRWLVDHHSLLIPIDAQMFGISASGVSAGFGAAGSGLLYAQGNHGLPVLLGVAGRLAGPAALLRLNVILGGIALLAVYGLARRLVSGPLACVVVLALSVSLPLLYVSRDTYSEPLTLIFLAGGTSLLWRAQDSRLVRHWGIAGLVLGSSALARIDSYASLLSVIVVAAASVALAPVAWRRQIRLALVLLVATGLPVLVGWLDATRLSPGYGASLSGNIHRLDEAAVGLLVLGTLATVVLRRTSLPHLAVEPARRRRIATVAAGLTAVGFLGFATRPLWQVTRERGAAPSYTGYIAALQQSQHLAPDPTRTYSEHTLFWQAWNYGWPTVALGAAGCVLLVWRLIARWDGRLGLFLVMGLSISGLYLDNAQIVPDQAWAMRRFVPVVIPLLVIATAYTIQEIGRLGRVAARLALALAVVTVAVPTVITFPIGRVRVDVPQLALVRAVCGALPAHAAVVELDTESASGYQQTVRSYCGLPSLGTPGATQADLAMMQATSAAHGRSLYALSLDPFAGPVVPASATKPFYSMSRATRWPATVEVVPQIENLYSQSVYLGLVAPDGTVSPLPPPPV